MGRSIRQTEHPQQMREKALEAFMVFRFVKLRAPLSIR